MPACVWVADTLCGLAVLLASHIALVAIRGNMARGQLIYKHPVPQGAPPPTLRGPPPGMGPPPEQYGDRRDFDVRGGPGGRAGADSLQGGPADPRMQGEACCCIIWYHA